MITTQDMVRYLTDGAKELLGDDEFDPLMMIIGADGTTAVMVLALEGMHPYDAIMAMAEKVRTKRHPVRIALAVDTYAYMGDEQDYAEWLASGARPSQMFADGHPDAFEAINITVVSVEGPDSSVVLAYERTPDGIKWGKVRDRSDSVEGRMVDAMRSMLDTHRPAD